jgi:DNA-binding response OmpR family regulator
MEKKYKILIVEDDPLIRTIYLERLSLDEEIEVDTAVDGLDGLNKIKVNTYNLVFSGIQMPNKTGFELFQDLQADSNLANMSFVIFSHLGRIEDIQKAKDLGIKNFIIRGSTTPDEVDKKIKDILDQDYNIKTLHTKIHKILIVEDKPEIRSVYVDRFSQDPHILVEEAVDGLDGLNKIKENTYDLIFSGIYMPNKTGFDLFKETQQLVDKKHIPIVLFSHWGKSEDIEMARQLGVQHFIVRGQSTPNNIFNHILDILNAKDKTYKLTIKKDSPDYAQFIESFFGQDCIEYKYNDGLPIKFILSKDVKPYTFFIELDCEDS